MQAAPDRHLPARIEQLRRVFLVGFSSNELLLVSSVKKPFEFSTESFQTFRSKEAIVMRSPVIKSRKTRLRLSMLDGAKSKQNKPPSISVSDAEELMLVQNTTSNSSDGYTVQ